MGNAGINTRADAVRREGDFYQEVLNREEQDLLPSAGQIGGLEEEISVVRLRVRGVLATEAKKGDEGGIERAKLLVRYLEVLNRLASTNYRITKKSQKDLAASIASVLQGVGAELGIEGPNGQGA